METGDKLETAEETATPRRADKAGLFQSGSNITQLNELKFRTLPLYSSFNFPIWTLAFLLLGVFLTICGYTWVETDLPLKQLGSLVLLVAVVVFPVETILNRVRISYLMKEYKPFVIELEEVRRSLSDYLNNLDRRTSRYFHCVTNTKVTTYFMLRQLENALNILLEELHDYLKTSKATNYTQLHARLGGVVEYRDGFAFNSGELHQVPITRISSQIQEYIKHLEDGIDQLESEIESYREQIFEKE